MVKTYKELRVYKNAIAGAIEIFQLTKSFPTEERYSLIDQVRRSSRSVCANIGEAWRKRRYQAAFIAKLSDAEAEATETQVWVELALKFGYISADQAAQLDDLYDHILSQLIWMISNSQDWMILQPLADPPTRRAADPAYSSEKR
jgi:four helix bundle protein